MADQYTPIAKMPGAPPSLGLNAGGQPGAGLDLKAKQDLVAAINTLVTALQAAFPQADAAVTATATGGAATLPANPVAFLTLTLAGTAYKVPLYNT